MTDTTRNPLETEYVQKSSPKDIFLAQEFYRRSTVIRTGWKLKLLREGKSRDKNERVPLSWPGTKVRARVSSLKHRWKSIDKLCEPFFPRAPSAPQSENPVA